MIDLRPKLMKLYNALALNREQIEVNYTFQSSENTYNKHHIRNWSMRDLYADYDGPRRRAIMEVANLLWKELHNGKI